MGRNWKMQEVEHLRKNFVQFKFKFTRSATEKLLDYFASILLEQHCLYFKVLYQPWNIFFTSQCCKESKPLLIGSTSSSYLPTCTSPRTPTSSSTQQQEERGGGGGRGALFLLLVRLLSSPPFCVLPLLLRW